MRFPKLLGGCRRLPEIVSLAPQSVDLVAPWRGNSGSLAIDRGLRILRRPGEPFDLNAFHPYQPRASVRRASGNVPVLRGSLIREWRRVGRVFNFENPAGIAL